MISLNSQPSIYLGTLRVDEPVVLLTNLMITAVCWFAYFRLRKLGGAEKAQQYFRLYFLAMGGATVLGGFFGHAFLYAFGFSWKLPGWTLSMFAVTMFSLAAIETARPLLNASTTRFFLVLNVIELITAYIVTYLTVSFKWVEFHSTYNLVLVVVPFHLYNYFKAKSRGSLVMICAVGVTAMTAVVFLGKISLGPWFNHLDVSHVFMATGIYIFYRAVVLLRD